MLDKEDFRKIRNELAEFDKARDELIRKSSEIIKLSKQVIYSLHRDDIKEAEKLVKILKKCKKELDSYKDMNEGSYNVALQEYVEALSFFSFIKENKISKRSELDVDTEGYLMGICDLSGELVRKALNSIIKNKESEEAKRIKDLLEEIYGEFLKFDLRNGNLRRKSDSIKYNMLKLEEMLYKCR